MISVVQAIILAVVEGITEFLPVSSTGHLIITSAIMGLNEDAFVKSFNIIIQFGAILSVIFLYWRRLVAPASFYVKVAVGVIPAGILGVLLKNKIDAVLGNVAIVGAALFAGGLILIFVDRQTKRFDKDKTVSSMSYRDAFIIGICQCFAFIPGVSRSAATIVAGLVLGLKRREAAEFSFFLAVPTLTGATVLKTHKIMHTVTQDQISVLLIGTFVAFLVASLAIKTFIDFLSRRGFFAFGIYRVILGLVVFVLLYGGVQMADAAEPSCVRNGCAKQLCIEEGAKKIISTCEWRKEFECLNQAICERQTDKSSSEFGKCGWTLTDAYKKCMGDNRTPNSAKRSKKKKSKKN